MPPAPAASLSERHWRSADGWSTASRRRDFLALLALHRALLLGGIYLTRFYVMDDALITLRYSFHLARHGRAIWNQADVTHPSLGYTTVLWMLLNAIPALLSLTPRTSW